MRPASLVASVALAIVAIAHALRLVLHTQVVVGGTVIPMWVSGLGGLAAAVLSIFLFREARPSAP